MVHMVAGKREVLAALCQKYGVSRLDLFGSAARGAFEADTSDLDFLVEFKPLEGLNAADQYFGLLEELEALFGRPVDLVMARAMKNPYFISSVERHKTSLYAA